MNDNEIVCAVRCLALKTNADLGEVKWYLFGSALKDLANASDIDLVVVCRTHRVADQVRRAVNVDQFCRPLHLSILTEAEQAEIRFIEKQGCIQVV
jgi:predicted nucleotidyltransferase